MKKILFALVVVMLMTSCNGQNNGKQQSENADSTKKVFIPNKMPQAPVEKQAPISEFNVVNPDGTKTPIKVEDGKPIDLSQLMGGRKKSFAQQMTDNIDSIRYKAEHGDAGYQYLYGGCYEQGWGVERSFEKALEWYMKSSDQKYAASFNSLGNLYRTGSGVVADAQKAFEWYEKGAGFKDPQAMLNLGNCYFFGAGTTKSIDEAVNWWEKAADAQNAIAESQMGDCYFRGIGVEKNLDKAIEYWTKAAEQQVPNAQFRLGVQYYFGSGVKEDKTYAKLLISKARDGGMTEAQKFLDEEFK